MHAKQMSLCTHVCMWMYAASVCMWMEAAYVCVHVDVRCTCVHVQTHIFLEGWRNLGSTNTCTWVGSPRNFMGNPYPASTASSLLYLRKSTWSSRPTWVPALKEFVCLLPCILWGACPALSEAAMFEPRRSVFMTQCLILMIMN